MAKTMKAVSHAGVRPSHHLDQNRAVKPPRNDRPRPVSGLIWLIQPLAMESSKVISQTAVPIPG